MSLKSKRATHAFITSPISRWTPSQSPCFADVVKSWRRDARKFMWGHCMKCSQDQKEKRQRGQRAPRLATRKKRQRSPDDRNKSKKSCTAAGRAERKVRKSRAVAASGKSLKKERVFSSESRTWRKESSSTFTVAATALSHSSTKFILLVSTRRPSSSRMTHNWAVQEDWWGYKWVMSKRKASCTHRRSWSCARL